VVGRGRRALVLVATSLAAFTATLDNTVVAVALRDLQRDLDAGVAELQGVVTAYTVALAALLLTGGTLADVAGRRRVLVAGLAVFAAASAGCATADSSTALIAWRGVQGVGAALVLPGSLAVLSAAHPEPAGRARAVGIWAATGAAALLAGPLVGGVLVEAAGWPSVFWVNLPLCALVAAVTALAPAGPPLERGRRLDLPGQLLAALGLAALTYAVVLGGRDGLGLPVLAAAAVGVVALVGFLAVERRAPDPVLPLALLRQRPLVGATVGAVRGQPRGLRPAGVPVAVPAARAAARAAGRRAAPAAAHDRAGGRRAPGRTALGPAGSATARAGRPAADGRGAGPDRTAAARRRG
jgi:DHA2 family methylenomycin A resistance protein-like MFS transporter